MNVDYSNTRYVNTYRIAEQSARLSHGITGYNIHIALHRSNV